MRDLVERRADVANLLRQHRGGWVSLDYFLNRLQELRDESWQAALKASAGGGREGE